MPSASSSRFARSSTARSYSAACFFDSPHSARISVLSGRSGTMVGSVFSRRRMYGRTSRRSAPNACGVLLLVRAA